MAASDSTPTPSPTCPGCGTTLPAGAMTCDNCGRAVGAFDAPQASGPTTSTPAGPLSGGARLGLVLLAILASASLVGLAAWGDPRDGGAAILLALGLPLIVGVAALLVFKSYGLGIGILAAAVTIVSTFIACFISCVSFLTLNFH